MNFTKELCGNTIRITWVNSFVTPTNLFCSVFDGNNVLVDSATMIDSGSGNHYYHNHTVPVNSPGFYTVFTECTIGGKPYKNSLIYKGRLNEVD